MYQIRVKHRIIGSLMQNDLYKFSMLKVIHNRHRDVRVGYTFINRGGTVFPRGFANELRNQIDKMADLKFTDKELASIKKTCGHFFGEEFIDSVLRNYSIDPHDVTIKQRGGKLKVNVDGLWWKVILWEIILLALISELYYVLSGSTPDEHYIEKAYEKAVLLNRHEVPTSLFGMRRRYSVEVEDNVTGALIEGAGPYFNGTSNLYFADKYNVTPIGTMAHEYYMGYSGLYGTRSATREGLKTWADEFQGYLGFTLTDTFTTAKFFEDFTPYYMKLFDGCRQDSGDPYEFVDRFVAHYRSLKVNPLTKQIVFSDGLDIEQAIRLNEYCKCKIFQALFGIGTHFTNDVGVKPLNIVIKLSYVIRPEEPNRRIYVVKLSDTPGKVTGEPKAVRFTRYELGLAA